jgi:uncharacterized membrane protein YdjX (TVP38/TMEM64 family)
MTERRQKLLRKGAILALLIILIFLLSRHGPQPFGFLDHFGEEWEDLERFYSSQTRLGRFLIALGPYSAAVFIVLQALQVVISPIPGELTGIVGGYVYGRSFGFILSTIGITLGSWLAFEIAKIFGRPFVERCVTKRVLDKFDFLKTNTGATLCFLVFAVPGIPKDYLCYILGLSPMSLTTFLVVSTVGRLPGTYLLTLQGDALRSQNYLLFTASVALGSALLLLAYLYRACLLEWLRELK